MDNNKIDVKKLRESILEFVNDEDYKPLKRKEIYLAMGFKSEDKELLYGTLEDLYREGLLYKTKKSKYCSLDSVNILTGTLQKNERGFGFLIQKDKNKEDVFISKNNMNGAMHQDVIAVKLTKKISSKGKREGEVVRVLSHEQSRMVGRFEKNRNFGFVIVDDKRFNDDVYIKKGDFLGAVDGDQVVVEIEVWPTGGRSAEGRIVEILGKAGQSGVDVLSILRSHGFTEEFPEDVLAEANNLPTEVLAEDIKGRRDLRDWKIFTIDGDDTKDIDDAISIKKLSNGNYRLGVHIADVSHYVTDGSLLDQEAYKRGTSVYMVDRVAPMLPKQLSNGICSLNPRVDRLALSVLMDIDQDGNVYSHDIFKSVIRSCEQMTYGNVYKILEEDNAELKERYGYLLEDFSLMKELSLILKNKRNLRGAINFDFPEAQIIIDDQGKAIDIVKREITIANGIIEEFMLVCNETVSEHYYWMDVPFMYRIHEEPDSEKMTSLAEFVRIMGYKLKGGSKGKVHPRALQELLNKVKGKKEERVINTIMLRSLQKARYSEVKGIHYGLAAQYYSHFTSPIRRYPDLTIHRIISYILAGEFNDEKKEHWDEVMPEYADHCSEMERTAETAERESVKVKMTEYMSHHIGERFTGVISSIASFGMFVELDNLVEGLVRVATMEDDYYNFDDRNYSFIGEHTNKVYKIGQEVELILTSTDIMSRTIEFELVPEDADY